MKSQKAIDRQPSPNAAVVLFGVDATGKPKAAKFGEKQASLASTAAGQMHLQIVPITNPVLADIASHLPAGRIYSNGRGLVPYIRRDLYNKLIIAAGPGPSTDQSPPTTAGRLNPSGNSAGPKGGPGHLPATWDEIGPGDLIIAQEDLPDGWYAAIVVERNGDMLTLRWRDFPQSRRFSEHRFNVGLLYPNRETSTPEDKELTGSNKKQPKTGTGKRPEPGAVDTAFPQAWDQISIDHLVLAKDDGPWRSWWEAIPVENNGDSLTLRWRDHSHVPNVVRGRFDLALLYPKAK